MSLPFHAERNQLAMFGMPLALVPCIFAFGHPLLRPCLGVTVLVISVSGDCEQ